MARIKQSSNKCGSLKAIQVLINKNQDLINKLIKSKFNELTKEDIIWTSPLENDEFAEYQGNDFIKKVGLNPNEIQLERFWPTKGPQWDALAHTNEGSIILVEAKANIPEIVSSETGAGEISKELINKSLYETKNFLNIENNIDWSGKFYQYTNRLSHLYFLREKCKKKIFLINIYFIGDESVSGPETKQEWEGAITVLHSYLRSTRHKLSKYMADIFINIKELDK